MKKIFLVFAFIFATIIANAQSFQWHQSYDNNQKLISDYFWTSANGSWNVFSWNEFTIAGDNTVTGRGLLYGEYKLGNTNFYVHPEVRLNTDGNFLNLGFAYRLPFENLGIYITPQYSRHQQGWGTSYVNDVQISINSSLENNKFYYEGYFDTYWLHGISCFTEQKVYYKITNNFHLGANLVFWASEDSNPGFLPFLVARISLY